MTAEHMLTDHLNQAAKNPDITLDSPHIHQDIDEPGKYQTIPLRTGTIEYNIYIKRDPQDTAYITDQMQKALQKRINEIYTYDDSLYILRTLASERAGPDNIKTTLEIQAMLKNPELKTSPTLIEKLIQWLKP